MGAPKPIDLNATSTRRFRRFGPDGPTYEVLDTGDKTLRVCVLETGEVFDYDATRAARDPDAD